ncbi:MAG: hypothetical protein CBC38_01995 [Gammaproteobacteria bacterium TMED78]|nr:MAG: hypothetical protein CBC38_01995 [Gammaproteobacteria bacterium TMED78]|tara:strand:- start:110029 stop:111429 length:1401 start_codon:yes stop_codon:yes gene_type:complete
MITEFSKLKILVVGDCMLDEYLFGETSRLSPEAPVPVLKVERRDYRPGGAANVALNLANLGVKTTLLSIIGKDDNGKILSGLIKKAKINFNPLKLDFPTIHKQRVLSRNHQLIRLDQESEIFGHEDNFLSIFKNCLKDTDLLIFSDYSKGALKGIEKMIIEANKKGVDIVVDPKRPKFDSYKGAKVITPNENEFMKAVGEWKDEEEFISKGISLRQKLRLDSLLVTRGEKGMTLFSYNKDPISLKARTREVYDVTGAGDTVVAVVSAGVAAGFSIERSANMANISAGLVVKKIGVASVSTEELEEATNQNKTKEKLIYSTKDLLNLVDVSKNLGEKIVMTNGCFDILHPGHIEYLKEAKARGDRLIVAINDDKSVKRIKGENRPVMTLEDRAKMLYALSYVDWIISFSEETPIRIISKILPDILVKGGDYKAEDIVGGDIVLKNGGTVTSLCFIEGHSSSELIKKN